MSHQTDLEVNRNIRRIFVRHWIDLGRLSIRTYQGRLSIRGYLQRIGGKDEELTTPIVEAMFAEIKRITSVQQVTAELENWTNDAGRWIPLERAPLGKPIIITHPTEVPVGVYKLDEDKKDQPSTEDK